MDSKDILKAVLKNAKSRKRDHIEYAWFDYLEENLSFPFEAEINLYSYSEVFKDGDIVKVIGIDNIIDLYGLLLNVKKGKRKYSVPLAELILLDTESRNFEILEAYQEWADN